MKIKISDILLVSATGILTALSFPKFNLSFLCWISFIPLLFVLSKKNPKQSFLLGLIAGISFYSLLIYWIPSVPAQYGNLSMGLSLFIYFLLVLFLSFFWAFFSLLFSKINQSFPRVIYFIAPCLWVSFEYLITYIFTGFPWGLIGYTQYRNLAFIQISSVSGIYALSFVLIFFQSFFLYSMRAKRKRYFFSALILVLLIHAAGLATLKKTSPNTQSFTASVIQGNVSAEIDWNESTHQEIRSLFEQHLELTTRAYEKGAQLVIWPEFSVPLCFSCPYGIYKDFKEQIVQIAQKLRLTLLLGSNEKTETQENVFYYNTALCIGPDLSISRYYKRHLVPFGEYTPYKKVFSFIEKMTHAIGEITPGTRYSLHGFKGAKFGSPICYEIIFPNLVRKFVKKGGNFLVTITNDGWYGKSSAPYQHFSIAVIRAVENRRYLLRAATTGISGIIDPYGRILSKSELGIKTYLTENITPLSSTTLYTKYGDILPVVSLTLSSIFLILAVIKIRNE